MKSWIRITSLVLFLIAGTVFFRHWSLLQFDEAFDKFGVFNVANTVLVTSRIGIDEATSSLLVKTDDEDNSTTSLDVVASSSPITNDSQISTTSTEILSIQATSTDLNLFLTFPKRGDELYIGCTYVVSWQSSTTVSSLGVVLVDAGTGEISGPVTGGLARENKIEADSQNLNWKVGVVWPGEYYIRVSKVNGIDTKYKSKVFEINKMSRNISIDEQENICKGSGGLF